MLSGRFAKKCCGGGRADVPDTPATADTLSLRAWKICQILSSLLMISPTLNFSKMGSTETKKNDEENKIMRAYVYAFHEA